jgi:hypothetical protein
MTKQANTWYRHLGTIVILAVTAMLLAAPQAGSDFGRCFAAEEQSDDNNDSDKKGDEDDSEPKAIRIKAGSDEGFTDSAGNEWIGEVGFEGGETIARPDDLEIENTEDPDIYRSEHYSMDSFSHKVPDGKYKVRLHFAETFEEIIGPDERVFSFNVEGQDFKDFDVAKIAGGINKAYIEEVEVDIKDGKLDITFTPDIQNPMINGIEIIPASEASE